DSKTELHYLSDLLEKRGYKIRTAENGEEAMRRLGEEKPDLILMDVVMPGQNGFQLTRAITRDPRFVNVPVIMCTSKHQEAGEIFAMAPIVPVPHAHGWFLGVSNLRGHLHGVVDLAGFLGVKGAEPLREQSRLVAFNANLEINCALLVDRLSGLRSEQQLTPQTDVVNGPRPPFVGARYKDDAGRAWQELNLAALAADEAFLRIVG